MSALLVAPRFSERGDLFGPGGVVNLGGLGGVSICELALLGAAALVVLLLARWVLAPDRATRAPTDPEVERLRRRVEVLESDLARLHVDRSAESLFRRP